jgi:hypothetical protein
LKAQLAARGRELDALRSSAQGARAIRQGNIDKRRLEAVDQLWDAVKTVQKGTILVSTIATLNWDYAADAATKDPKAQQLFKVMAAGIDLAALHQHNAHAARPYITPLANSLFGAYSVIIAFAASRIMVLQNGVGKAVLVPEQGTFDVIIAALPEYKEMIDKQGVSALPAALGELEKRLLAELQRGMEGEEDDKAQVERAAKIAEMVKEADRKINAETLPKEMRA